MTTKKTSTRFPFFKTVCIIAMVFLSIMCAVKSHASECSCDHVYTGAGRIDLYPGQTLCVQSGIFSQAVLSNDQNRQLSDITICVAEGATYQHSSDHKLFSFPNSKIVNRGKLIINGASVEKRAYITNYGSVEVIGNLNMNGSLEGKNFGVWIDKTNFVLKNQSLFINDGLVSIKSDFNSGFGTTFINNNRMEIGNNFNPGGEFYNNGPLVVKNFSEPNGGSKFINQCFFYSENGFNNNFYQTENYGLIQVGLGKKIQLNHNFFQSAQGTIRGGDFINSGNISGGGFYYFSGDTRNQGSFHPENEIVHFFDETKKAKSRVFDLGSQIVASTDYFIPMDTVAVKQMICPGAPSILPVELVSFTASRDGMLVQLNWVTASELNSDYFIIERSYDGFNFEEIGWIAGSGTTSVPQNYNFTDDESVNSLESIAYYRLKQVDFDGKSETFQIVSVDLSDASSLVSKKFGFYPNPTRDMVHVPGSEGILKQFFSLSGNLIHSTREVVSDISHFVSGLYILKIGEWGEVVERLLKI